MVNSVRCLVKCDGIYIELTTCFFLGYESDEKYQLFPRKVQSPLLKKLAIIGAAASSVHSVVYAAYEVFTFGYNQGQLGMVLKGL